MKRVFVIKLSGDDSLEELDPSELRNALLGVVGPQSPGSDFAIYGVELFEI